MHSLHYHTNVLRSVTVNVDVLIVCVYIVSMALNLLKKMAKQSLCENQIKSTLIDSFYFVNLNDQTSL